MLEVHWPEYFDLLASEAARSNDREFQQRVYDGLVRSCGKPLADCSDQTLRNIALVAAGMGDGPRMKAALAAWCDSSTRDPNVRPGRCISPVPGRIAKKYCVPDGLRMNRCVPE